MSEKINSSNIKDKILDYLLFVFFGINGNINCLF